MKASCYDVNGKVSEKIDLPKVFSTPIRKDLILRAVLSIQAKKRQAHGTDLNAGTKSSAAYHGRRRRVRWTMMNREMSRNQRIHGKVPGYLMYRARNTPSAVKGRQAFPPLTWTDFEQKMNKKEHALAIKSAIAATADRKSVETRGHKVKDIVELPIVFESGIEKITKTAVLKKLFEEIHLKSELERIGERTIRAGKGKFRGRKYRQKVGPLMVVVDDKNLSKAANNMPGVNVVRVDNLSVEYLAPGASPGRLTIFTKDAIAKLEGRGKKPVV
jgi:large subunit ribosomal protein L4e